MAMAFARPSARTASRAERRTPPPLDAAALDGFAVRYLGRYATTAARLRDFLARKLRERGWAEAGDPPIDAIVARCVAAGYVDDDAFAAARSRSLGRRGYGNGRIATALAAAGIDKVTAGSVAQDDAAAFAAADAFARKRRIGPYATTPATPDLNRRQLAAMVRAGHPWRLAQRFVRAAPGDMIENDA